MQRPKITETVIHPSVRLLEGLAEGLAQDLSFHGFAAERALEFADAVFEFAHAADGDDLLVGPDCLLPALCHAPGDVPTLVERRVRRAGDGDYAACGLWASAGGREDFRW